MAQVGVGVKRDMGALNAQVFVARDFLDVAVEVDDALGQKLSAIMAEGPDDALTLTGG